MRTKNLQVRRIVIGTLLGFLARLMYEQIQNLTKIDSKLILVKNSFPKNPSKHCLSCHIDDVCSVCPPTNVQLTLDPSVASAYKPKGMYEVTRWLYFDQNHVYDIINEEPKLELNGLWKEEFKAATQVAMEYININKMLKQSWSLVRLQNGYMKSDSIRGTDYMLDLLVSPTSGNTSSIRSERTFRVQMVHPLVPIKDAKVISVQEEPKPVINIIIPISPGFEDLEIFLRSLAKSISEKEVYIVIVWFTASKIQTKNRRNIIEAVAVDNPQIHFIPLEEKGSFNFLTGLRAGVKTTKKGELILVLTEDTFFFPPLLDHCRFFALPNKRVYFPIAFAQFDPTVIEEGMPPGKPKNINKKDHTKFAGQWDHQTHNYVCAYHSDLVDVLASRTPPARPKSRKPGRWMYDKFLINDVQVITAVEPHLYKLHNNEHCIQYNPFDGEKKRCLSRKSEFLGAKLALGILYINESSREITMS